MELGMLIFVTLVAGLVLAMGALRGLQILHAWFPPPSDSPPAAPPTAARVNHLAPDAPIILSSSPPRLASETAPSVQTDGQTRGDRTMIPMPTTAQMLDSCRVLRQAGLTRDQARAALKALGLPLDNNLWSQAAPPAAPTDDDQLIVTPFAGRVTRREYYPDDPGLVYQEPPPA